MEAAGAKVWCAVLVFRLVNALLVRTYFNPDEYWQSLEIAHRLVFGYGYEYVQHCRETLSLHLAHDNRSHFAQILGMANT